MSAMAAASSQAAASASCHWCRAPACALPLRKCARCNREHRQRLLWRHCTERERERLLWNTAPRERERERRRGRREEARRDTDDTCLSLIRRRPVLLQGVPGSGLEGLPQGRRVRGSAAHRTRRDPQSPRRAARARPRRAANPHRRRGRRLRRRPTLRLHVLPRRRRLNHRQDRALRGRLPPRSQGALGLRSQQVLLRRIKPTERIRISPFAAKWTRGAALTDDDHDHTHNNPPFKACAQAIIPSRARVKTTRARVTPRARLRSQAAEFKHP